MDCDEQIQSMIDKPYLKQDETIRSCQLFCRDIWKLLSKKLPDDTTLWTPKKVNNPQVGDLVLFALGGDWHCGIVWPNGLEFVHACPDERNKRTLSYIVKKDRLTVWPWKKLIKGFYR